MHKLEGKNWPGSTLKNRTGCKQLPIRNYVETSNVEKTVQTRAMKILKGASDSICSNGNDEIFHLSEYANGE